MVAADEREVGEDRFLAAFRRLRVGTGFDAHPFATDLGRELVICGQRFPGVGLCGHSDADVGTHAVADAILGAAGLGGIGDVFSDTDPDNAGADSIDMLTAIVDKVKDLGFEVINVDLTIICEEPRIAPFRLNMALAIENVTSSPVTVKAKRPEKMGALGRKEGIAAICSALLYERAV